MRILVIESTVFGYDGITNVIKNYYIYQDHKKIHMDFVTINSVDEEFKTNLQTYDSVNYILPFRNKNTLKYIFDLIKIIKDGNYQIVHVHGCSATMAIEMFAARVAGVKVRIAHSHNTKCDHVKIDKILRPFFYKWCNVAFACGREAGEWMFHNRKFEVISNGVDLEKFQYNEDIRKNMRMKHQLEGKVVIGHIGRFSEQKNHVKLLDIFKEVTKANLNSKLVLIGDGALRVSIEEKAGDMGLDTVFVGLSDIVDQWLQAIDIIVFPSLYEGLPLVLIEAQAAGLPCILSNTISEETKVTDLVEFVDLTASSTVWCEAIERNIDRFNRKSRKSEINKYIRKAHLDIRANCVELAKKYESLMKIGC